MSRQPELYQWISTAASFVQAVLHGGNFPNAGRTTVLSLPDVRSGLR
jgi:hypothetical protein